VSTINAPIDTATIRREFERWARQESSESDEPDFAGFAALLTHYLSQPLSDSENYS